MTTLPTVLIAGCGRWGTRIRTTLLARPVHVIGVDPAPGTWASHADLATLAVGVDDLHAVLATPADSGRALQLAQLIRMGAKRVRIEKPIATTLAEVATIERIAQLHREVRISVGLQQLATPNNDLLCDVAGSRDAWSIMVRRTARGSGRAAEAMVDLAPHDFAMLAGIFGPVTVDERHNATTVCFTAGGHRGLLEAGWTNDEPVRSLAFASRDRLVTYDEIPDRVEIAMPGGHREEHVAHVDRLARSLDYFLVGGGPILTLGTRATRLAIMAAQMLEQPRKVAA